MRKSFNYLATISPRHPRPVPTLANPLGLTKRRLRILNRDSHPALLRLTKPDGKSQHVIEYSNGTRYAHGRNGGLVRISPRPHEIRKGQKKAATAQDAS